MQKSALQNRRPAAQKNSFAGGCITFSNPADARPHNRPHLISPAKAQALKARQNNSSNNANRQLRDLKIQETELEKQNAKLMEEIGRLKATLANYINLYDFAPVGYLSLDEAGVIREANLTCAFLWGDERHRLINQRIMDFVSPTARPAFLAFLARAFNGTGAQSCDVRLQRWDGGDFQARLHAQSLIVSQTKPSLRRCALEVAASPHDPHLSLREIEVLRLIATSRANKQTAAELGISMRTVEKHRTHLMEKLNIHDTAGLTRYAINSGLIKSMVRLNIF